MTEERWVAALGYEWRYEVSDLGRIRSLPRIEIASNGGRRIVRGCYLKTRLTADGYPNVSLRQQGKLRKITVHVIVARAFHGDKRNILHNEVAHLDGDRTNAKASNLKWVSKVENRSHRKLHGTECGGEANSRALLTDAQAREIYAKRGIVSGRAMARHYGVSVHTIEGVTRGRNYRNATQAPAMAGAAS